MQLPANYPASTSELRPSRRLKSRDVGLLPFLWTKTGNTKTGDVVRRVTHHLSDHVGGNPSYAQSLIISRSAWLWAHLASLDEAAIRNGGLSDHDATKYASLNSALTETLSTLGLQAVVSTTKVDDPPEVVAA